jgi:hypothetical protein
MAAVEHTQSIDSSKPFEAGSMSADIAAMMRSKDEQIVALSEQVAALQHQIVWFRRQILGQKSERFIASANPELNLGEPQSYLVEPGGVGWREVQAKLRMRREEGL